MESLTKHLFRLRKGGAVCDVSLYVDGVEIRDFKVRCPYRAASGVRRTVR